MDNKRKVLYYDRVYSGVKVGTKGIYYTGKIFLGSLLTTSRQCWKGSSVLVYKGRVGLLEKFAADGKFMGLRRLPRFANCIYWIWGPQDAQE